jgi:hypothetical protein
MAHSKDHPLPTLNTYVDPAEVHKTPSRVVGIDEETETQLRIFGCELIQEAGILLRLYPLRPHVILQFHTKHTL